jgi:hypothetical protein
MCLSTLGFGAACDLRVAPGQTVVVDNGAQFFGAAGPSASSDQAGPAAIVDEGGTLIVQDAGLFGGGFVPNPSDAGGVGAPGIQVSEAGTVVVFAGTIQGGNVSFQADPQSPPDGRQVGVGGIGININLDSVLDIRGGTIVGGSVTTFQPDGQQFGVGGVAIRAVQTDIAVSGGQIRPGTVQGKLFTNDQPYAANIYGGTLDVSGGTFQGKVQVNGVRSVIRGGSLPVLELSDPLGFGPTSGCTEIRGGSVGMIRALGNENVFIFGTGFNVPPGVLPVSSPTGVTGTFADGTPIATLITRVNTSSFPSLGIIRLVAPGSPGCP